MPPPLSGGRPRRRWDGAGISVSGAPFPADDLPFRRWREVLVHHADLGDAGYTPSNWPAEYVDEELRRLVDAGADIRLALRDAAAAASRAAAETTALSPRLGRARPLAERSVGHPDPGAVSFGIIVGAASTHIGRTTQEEET